MLQDNLIKKAVEVKVDMVCSVQSNLLYVFGIFISIKGRFTDFSNKGWKPENNYKNTPIKK